MTAALNWNILYKEEVASTNTFLKELNKDKLLPEGTVVCALNQTAGRGQAGNYWESESGKNLCFSVLLRPQNLAAREQFVVSKAVALAVYACLQEYTGGISIKWPNDIYYGDNKIAGILIENEWEGTKLGSCVLGIGLNVNQTCFVSNAPNPISLRQIIRKEVELHHLLTRFLEHLQQEYRCLEENRTNLEQRYRTALYRGEGYFPYQDKEGNFIAKILEVKPEGYLVLETTEGERRQYLFKEVSFVL